MDKHKVAIVNTHPVVLQGLAQVVNQEVDLIVCAEISEAGRALEILADCKPDVIVVDISENEISRGIELVKSISSRHPSVPVLVLSMHSESFYAEIAFRAGAKGYICLSESTNQIIAAIRQALAHDIYVSEKMAVDIVSRLVNNGRSGKEGMTLHGFTDREFEIFEYIGRGMSVRQIAERLGRSVKTIEAHREHIKKKLKLQSTTEVMRRAIHWVEYQKVTG